MRLRFGTFANVLYLCGVRPLEKRALLNTICRSVDKTCDLSSAAVTALLQCTTDLPVERSNGRGNVVSAAADAETLKVAEYFSTKIITPLIDTSKRKLAVCAIRGIIMNDDTIDGETIVEPINGITKNELRERSKFVLSEFLAGVFLFAAGMTNRVGKQYSNKITDNFVESFRPEEKTISFITRKAGKPDQGAAVAEFNIYLEKVAENHGMIKTLLYFYEPKPISSFYVPNYVEHTVGHGTTTIRDVTVEKLAAVSNFLILGGVGGLGKTMMLRHLLFDAVKSFRETHRIPIFVPLREFDTDKGDLLAFIYKTVTDVYDGVDEEALVAMLRDGYCLLLLDGLDEMDDSRSAVFERQINAFVDKYSKNCYVISSRPFQNFVSFTRFTVMELVPFTLEQAAEMIEKLEFRPKEPQVKERFVSRLKYKYFVTHRAFAENPLLLTIMLLTFDKFGDVPDRMHVFYGRAFETLSEHHDYTKGYSRKYKTGLFPQAIADYFAEFCFRTYFDNKFEFGKEEFARYFKDLWANKDANVTCAQFVYDLRVNLYLLNEEGARHYFMHRSFQEYFCAVFFAKAPDSALGGLTKYLEKYGQKARGDSMFTMLYDMVPQKVAKNVFAAYLKGLLEKCESGGGYWTFLEEIYPHITYDVGEVPDYTTVEPSSYLCGFILNVLKPEHKFECSDLPEDDELLIDEYARLQVGETECELLSLDEIENNEEYAWVQEVPEAIGATYEFDVTEVNAAPLRYSVLRDALDDDAFVLKAEYNALCEYYEKLTTDIQSADEFFAGFWK